MPKYSKGYLKLKKEIEKIPDFNKGIYASFYLGYVHGICDYNNYGKITMKEAIKLEKLFNIKKENKYIIKRGDF